MHRTLVACGVLIALVLAGSASAHPLQPGGRDGQGIFPRATPLQASNNVRAALVAQFGHSNFHINCWPNNWIDKGARISGGVGYRHLWCASFPARLKRGTYFVYHPTSVTGSDWVSKRVRTACRLSPKRFRVRKTLQPKLLWIVGAKKGCPSPPDFVKNRL